MRSTWFSRAARASIALALLSATAVTVVAAKPGPERPGRRRAVNLFAVTNGVLNVNRVFCGINNLGELCVDPTNSPVLAVASGRRARPTSTSSTRASSSRA